MKKISLSIWRHRSDAELDSLLLAGPIRSGRLAVVGHCRARRGEAIVAPPQAAPLWAAPASLPTPSCPSATLVCTTTETNPPRDHNGKSRKILFSFRFSHFHIVQYKTAITICHFLLLLFFSIFFFVLSLHLRFNVTFVFFVHKTVLS